MPPSAAHSSGTQSRMRGQNWSVLHRPAIYAISSPWHSSHCCRDATQQPLKLILLCLRLYPLPLLLPPLCSFPLMHLQLTPTWSATGRLSRPLSLPSLPSLSTEGINVYAYLQCDCVHTTPFLIAEPIKEQSVILSSQNKYWSLSAISIEPVCPVASAEFYVLCQGHVPRHLRNVDGSPRTAPRPFPGTSCAR